MKKRHVKAKQRKVVKKNRFSFVKLLISLIIPLLTGFIGSLLTIPSISTWYSSILKSSLNPPNWIFMPVWALLFILMGISLYIIWNKNIAESKKKTALFFFSIQLFLNIAWSLLFFTLHQPLYALIEMLVLWLSILFMILAFYKISKIAGLLQVPYILWVSFASYLTFMVAILN